MMNYAGCSQCGESSAIVMVNKQTTEDEDGQEVITYQHICQSCSHVIANHEHVFHVEDDYQVYGMYCLLCGQADDQRSILPCDPNGPRKDSSDFD
ncbi:protein Churchill-like isoform X2 [Mya arenaria]|nr:protein Churchill-like isoform X2 [Mya arenaria]